MPSSPGTLDVSYATSGPCGGTAERCHTYTVHSEGAERYHLNNTTWGFVCKQAKWSVCPDQLGSCASLQWRWRVLTSVASHTGSLRTGLWGKHTQTPCLWCHWAQKANSHRVSRERKKERKKEKKRKEKKIQPTVFDIYAVFNATCCCRRTWWRCSGCCAAGCPLWGWKESRSAPAHRSPSAPGRTSDGCARWGTEIQTKRIKKKPSRNKQNNKRTAQKAVLLACSLQTTPPVGLGQVKTLHAGGVPFNPLEHRRIVIQIPGVEGQTCDRHNSMNTKKKSKLKAGVKDSESHKWTFQYLQANVDMDAHTHTKILHSSRGNEHNIYLIKSWFVCTLIGSFHQHLKFTRSGNMNLLLCKAEKSPLIICVSSINNHVGLGLGKQKTDSSISVWGTSATTVSIN